jgi:hypothetical protein
VEILTDRLRLGNPGQVYGLEEVDAYDETPYPKGGSPQAQGQTALLKTHPGLTTGVGSQNSHLETRKCKILSFLRNHWQQQLIWCKQSWNLYLPGEMD